MSASQRRRKRSGPLILWQCGRCRSWLRDDRLMEVMVETVCTELLDPLREATELATALIHGPDELRRRILTRVAKSVAYVREGGAVEIVLVLPQPEVPLLSGRSS